MLDAKRQLNLTQKAINDGTQTLKLDGVLAEQAGHSLHAYATNTLWLDGKRIASEKCVSDGMNKL